MPEETIKQSKLDEVIRDLYNDIVEYQKELLSYNYDDQTRRSNREELRILGAKIEVCRNTIKRLQGISTGGDGND